MPEIFGKIRKGLKELAYNKSSKHYYENSYNLKFYLEEKIARKGSDPYMAKRGKEEIPKSTKNNSTFYEGVGHHTKDSVNK